jgi:hypothetical protein
MLSRDYTPLVPFLLSFVLMTIMTNKRKKVRKLKKKNARCIHAFTEEEYFFLQPRN